MRVKRSFGRPVVEVILGLSIVIVILAEYTFPCYATIFRQPKPSKSAPVKMARFDQKPVIDGVLDEPIWNQARVLGDFVQTAPGDNTAPSYPTEVRLGYDTKCIYIGIRANDPSGQIRATLAKRDAILNDDQIRIFLDTFDDKRRAYLLVFNPLGIQQDGIFTEGKDPDYSFDLVMESKGVVKTDGYTIEVAIPFSSLRYASGKDKAWGLQIQRRIKHRNDEEDSWQPLIRGNSGFLVQAGRLTGLEGIGNERYLEIIPSLTISEKAKRVPAWSPPIPTSAEPGRLVNLPLEFDLGLTAKVGLSPNVTLDAAVNPDFAQVESDQLVVTANQRFPIFFEEKRPFFLEGIDIFQTPITVVHTRTIIDPDVAVKLTGKRGRNTFGILLASDNAPGDFSEEDRTDPSNIRFVGKNAFVGVLRFKHDLGSESSIGLLATSRDFIEDHNRVLAIDGRFAFDRNTVGYLQLLGTTTRSFFYDPDRNADLYRTGNGFGYYAKLQRTGRHLNITLTGSGRTRDYRAAVGFTSQTNTNPWNLSVRYNSEPKLNGRLISWTATQTSLAQFDFSGRMKYSYQNPTLQFNFKRQTFLNLSVYADYYRLFEEEFGPRRTATQAGAFLGSSERSTTYTGYTVTGGTTPSKKLSFNISVDGSWKTFDFDFGAGPRFPRVSPAALIDPNARLDPGLGNSLDISSALVLQPSDALNLSLNYVKSRLVRTDTHRTAYDQDLYSLRATYQFSRFTFARARIDYDDLSAKVLSQILVGWTPNPGTAVYVGYDDDLNRNGYNSFTAQFEPGLRRNGRTFFIKLSYLYRRLL